MSYWDRPSKRTRRGEEILRPLADPKPVKTPSPTRSAPRGPRSNSMDALTSASKSAASIAEHLRASGWRETREKTPHVDETTFCTCRAPEDKFEIEEVIQCMNRGCKIEYFHLTCMALPDHPPRGIGWNCPTCRADRGDDASSQTGLFDQRHFAEEGGWRAWMEAEGCKVPGPKPKKRNVEKKKTMKAKKTTKVVPIVARKKPASESTESDKLSPSESPTNSSPTEESATEVSPTLKRKRNVEVDDSSSGETVDVVAEVPAQAGSSSTSELTEFEEEDK